MKNPTHPLRIKSQSPKRQKLAARLGQGRAYTLIELADFSGLSRPETQTLLQKGLRMKKIRIRYNRKKTYYYSTDPRTSKNDQNTSSGEASTPQGMKYCRHCYKHLAGYVGVKLTQALVDKAFLLPHQATTYTVTEKGWQWFKGMGVCREKLEKSKTPIAGQCLDFSERQSHLKGKLGEALLEKLLKRKWLEVVPNSRTYHVTDKGNKLFHRELGMSLPEK